MDRSVKVEERVLRHLLTVVCGWEFVALTTRRIPTVSALVWRGAERRQGRLLLVSLWLGVAAYLTEHFFGAGDNPPTQ